MQSYFCSAYWSLLKFWFSAKLTLQSTVALQILYYKNNFLALVLFNFVKRKARVFLESSKIGLLKRVFTPLFLNQ